MTDEKEFNPNLDGSEENDQEEPASPLERFFYHQRRAVEETSKALEALLPPEFKKHSTEASKEFGKGFRILIDAAIDELKKVSERDEEAAAAEEKQDDDDDDKPSTTGKTKVKVNID